MNNKLFLSIAGFYGLTAVMLGAFGAHALEALLSPDQLDSYETGVRYQMYHTLALLAVVLICEKFRDHRFQWVAWLFVVGAFLFSGSIYLLSCRGVLGIESYKWLGPVTPIGGSLLIIGWAYFLFLSLKIKSHENL